MSDMATFLNLHRCANTEGITPCTNEAPLTCSGCLLVQYCSKVCQKADLSHHKTTCKSAFVKETWNPAWFTESRTPAFFGGSAPITTFGTLKYLWGNMPALDILNIKDNEGTTDAVQRDFNLLFAASGDLRNAIKSIVGLPDNYNGECVAVLNDMEFLIVARNAIMLLIALYMEHETAVPMIIHLWYSALLPSAMILVIENKILPLIQDVCDKTKDKPDDSLQAKTFSVNDRKLRIVLRRMDWYELANLCKSEDGFTAEKSQEARRGIMLAPERVDFRDRGMLSLPKAVRQGEMHFRETGVLLPYSCPITDFVVPNPTLFPAARWSMKDSSTPREGWLHSEYMKGTPCAKADEFGALFFHLRRLLLQFCKRIHSSKVSFQLFNMDARKLENCIQGLKFDRIEISNICDIGYIGPQECLGTFSPLLRSKTQSPNATLLMLFMNAAPETEHRLNPRGKKEHVAHGMKRMEVYRPMTPALAAAIRSSAQEMYHPDLVLRTESFAMFKDWDKYFDCFVELMQIPEAVRFSGLTIKKDHTIVQRWPTRVRPTSTTQEFDVLCASGTSGYERYMEFEKAK